RKDRHRRGDLVEFLDAAHPSKRQHDGALDGRRAAGKPGQSALRHDGHARLVTDPQHGRYVRGAARPHQCEARTGGHRHYPVAQMPRIDGVPVDDRPRSDGLSNRPDDCLPYRHFPPPNGCTPPARPHRICPLMMTTSSMAPEDRASSITARRRRGLAVVLFFVALTVVFSWPLPVRMTTHLLARDPDIDLLMWALGWNAHAFLHQPFALFDANIFYPAKYALAYSENMIGSAVLTAPLIWLTGDLLLTMNVVQLSSVLLSAVGAYLLGRRLGLGVPAAVLTGIVFGFAPARFFRMPQAHLTTIQWLPFCLAYLHSYFGAGGRARDLRLAVFFFTAQALTSGHGAVFLTVAVVLYLGYRLGRGERPDIVRRNGDLGIPGALLLLPSVLIIGPYRAARLEAPSLARGLDDFGSSVSSYVSTPAHAHQWLLSLM